MLQLRHTALAAGSGSIVLPFRGWRWLLLAMLAELFWIHVVSLQTHGSTALIWLPSLGVVLGGVFLWQNRTRRGLWVMAVGGALNCLVMVANGGLMPLAPTALPHLSAAHRMTGQIVTHSKDRVISEQHTRFAMLDDRLVGAVGQVRIAASVGDTLVAVGLLITLGEEIWMGAYFWRTSPRLV